MSATARYVVAAAAIAMGVAEIIAVFVEGAYAVVLALLLLLGAAWSWWRRDSAWPVIALSLLFLLELVYLSDYDWADTTDRAMIIVTVAVCVTGLLGAVIWFLTRRRAVM